MKVNVYHTCRDCRFYRRDYEWEMPHIFWHECDMRPQMANLTSFPFKRTSCEYFKPKDKYAL
uniref:Uncharacterized protein n=1 Tax=viral metagenome TaxID=1070528 RepID=A0A6H2A1Z4_9ZZZZ